MLRIAVGNKNGMTESNTSKPGVSGDADPRFAPLKDFFSGMLEDGREVGAAVAVCLDGKPVADLWGGWADPALERPWDRNTIVSTFSVSKAMVSTLGHRLADQGAFDFDRPVAEYWPAFGQNGKHRIPVRHLFDHRCALCYVDRKLRPGDLYDWDLMIAAIEETAPNWEWGVRPAYLNMTYGYLLGGLMEKLTGKRLGRLMRDELAGPLGLDFHFALTPEEKARCARVLQDDTLIGRLSAEGDSPTARSMQGFAGNEDFNSDGWRSGEVGSGQGHGNARAIARHFAMMVAGGTLEGTEIMSRAARDRAIEFQCESDGEDPIMGTLIRFALGYELNCNAFPMGPNPKAFGHWGAGGSFGFGDIETGLAFGYTPNYMHPNMELGPRGTDLVRQVFNCL